MISIRRSLPRLATGLAVAALLSACGGGGGGGTTTPSTAASSYVISGSVKGLASGTQVTLLDNNGNPDSVSANGSFAFSTDIPSNGSFAVTVGTQPTGETCTVSNGTGAGVTANVTNVAVTCSTNTYTLGGSVSGLPSGEQVVLLDNGGDAATVSANGTFNFNTPVAYNGSYAVTVGTQPTGATCTVAHGTGAGVTANVNGVAVTCATTATSTYTIGGSVSGLTGTNQVTLANNGADLTTVTSNGSFAFATPIASGTGYSITVGTQPNGETCTVSSGTGSNVTANVTNVAVTCATTSTGTYTIGGTVTGLTGTNQVTLDNNGANPTIVSASGNAAFTFATPVASGTGYAVTVGTQPTGETCTVTNGTGSNVTANVTNVSIACSSTTSTLVYSTGFAASSLTPEGGTYGGYSGSNLDGYYCPPGSPADCGTGGATISSTVTAANSSFYSYYQSTTPTSGEYVGAFVLAPGVTKLSGAADTNGVQVTNQTHVNFTFSENPEWATSPDNNFMVELTLGKFFSVGGGCHVQLQAVIHPGSVAAAQTATVYSIPLSLFTVAQNCGQGALTPTSPIQALALYPVSQFDIQGDSGAAALTRNNLTTGANTSNITSAGVYPTTVALQGGITFTP